MERLLSVFCTIAVMAAAPARADSVAFSIGTGDHADIAALSAQFEASRPVREFAASTATAYLDASVAYLRGTAGETNDNEIFAIGATPVLRLSARDAATVPYVEAGIGVRLLSDTEIYDTRHFSTAFQFGELIGAGLRFGPQRAYELGLRVEHISNGGIKQPNNGLSFAVMRVAYHYR